MAEVLVIADDLTGALEAGAKFAAQGIPALVTTQPVPDSSYPVVVMDTESRHLSAEGAAAAVSRACATPARILYKKTDSTLRGNIGSELRAMLALRPEGRVVYIPAYPGVGRTVRGGRLYVDGVPVHESEFADDALNPIAESCIAGLLGDLPCTVHDGESDADVLRATAAALEDEGRPILAGPASVAEAMAGFLDIPRHAIRPWPRVVKCLVVNGSLHEASIRQIAYAEGRDCEPWQIFRGTILADLEVIRCLESSGADCVMVFGGDTAFGILKALGSPPLEPLGEVVTGVPVSRVIGRNLTLITKAGGYGDESLIFRVREALHANQR